MRFSVYIDWDRATGGPENFRQFYPDNVEPFKLAIDKETRDMSKFFYRLLWSNVSLSNSPYLYTETANDIYRLFEFIYNLDFSQKVFIRYVTPSRTINGYFGRNDCEFDYNRKTLSVEPAVIDNYTDILENWKNEVDFSEWTYVEPETTIIITNDTLKTVEDWPWPSINNAGPKVYPRNRIKESDYDTNGELGIWFTSQAPNLSALSDGYYGFGGTHRVWTNPIPTYSDYNLNQRIEVLGETVTPATTDNIPIEYGDYELSRVGVYEGSRGGGLSGKRWRSLYCETEFSRDEYIKVDVVDVGNPYGYESPVGDSWNMREIRIKDGQNAHIWTRKPFNGAYSNAWELQPDVTVDGERNYDFAWHKYRETKLIYDNSDRSFSLVSTIKLRDFLEHILQNTAPELSTMNIKSTFLFNDDEGDLEMLEGTTGYNYVFGGKNYLNGLKLFFTKDLVPAEDDEVSKVAKFTLYEILNEFHRVFFETLVWFIDDNGDFRIEHERYVDLRKTVVDLTGSELLNFTSQWDYDKSLMFERFEFRQQNAGYKDFTNNLVEYDKIISNNRNQDLKYEIETRVLSTDAKYCILNPNDINDGMVLISVDDTNVVRNKVGRISKILETNGFLALSNILWDFARYEGVWFNGTINSEATFFTVTKRNKLGIELTLRGAKESLFYITQLGYGLLEDGSIDYENEQTKLVLRYRYNSSVNGDLFVLAFQKETDFVGAANNWADFENYTISS